MSKDLMDIATWNEVFRWIMLGLGGALSIMIKLFYDKIDRLEKHVDTKADMKTVIDMQSLMKEHRDETRNSFNSIGETLNVILLRLGDKT